MPQDIPDSYISNKTDFEFFFHVGEWKVDPNLNSISKTENGQVIERIVTPKVMATCILLAKSSPSTISQQQMADNIWPEQAISDSSIYQVIAQLRKAFDDVGSSRQFIERVSGKGYRLVAPISQLSTITAQQSNGKPKRKWLFLTGLVLVLLSIVVAISYNQRLTENTSSVSQISQLQSIAVTRAKNHTQPKIDQFDIFNDLLMSELIKIGSLRIVNLRDDSQVPNTDATLSTAIQKRDKQLQINIQLTTTRSHQVLWAKIYNGEVSDLFSIQEQINNDLTKLFRGGKVSGEKQAPPRVDDDTYLQYVLALHLWDRRTPGSLTQAIKIYQDILKKEPHYAKALVGLCNSYLALHVYSNWSKQKAIVLCHPLLDEAYRYAPDNGEILATKALLLANNDNRQAVDYFEQAIRLAPNYAFAYQWYGTFLRNNGNYRKALEMHQKAFSLAPLSPGIIRSLAYSHLNLRQMKQARKFYQRALTIEPVYSHRALEELDFLPLNVVRANNFLQWVKNEQQNPTMLPVYQLTHVLVLLSVNKIEYAEKHLKKLDNQQLNPAFHLYVQAALAAAKGDLVLARNMLKQRLDIAPEVPRYAMPYIAALHANKQYQKALDIFQTYFPEINQKTAISIENYNMFIFLNDLVGENNKKLPEITAQLSAFFDSTPIPDTALGKIYWQDQNGQKLAAKKDIERLINSGWLPDYNDNIFAEKDIKEIYLSSDGLISDWIEKMNANQSFEQ